MSGAWGRVCVCAGGWGVGGGWRVGQNLLWEQLMNRGRGDKLLVMKGKRCLWLIFPLERKLC